MDEILTQRAEAYVLKNNLRLAERLGHGIHGIYAGESNSRPGNVAIKAHRSEDGYCRERDVYLRLQELGIEKIFGLNVPRLTRFDDQLWIVEMTIVSRPFLLDFAGAYLDRPPQFSDEIWQEWESEKKLLAFMALENSEYFYPEWNVEVQPLRKSFFVRLYDGSDVFDADCAALEQSLRKVILQARAAHRRALISERDRDTRINLRATAYRLSKLLK